ncbi:phosphomannomutase/phosphoglucomutase [Patescibacteria group bacterium]|nr:phosphomannomutase/phosphoglucomutase [Patescibacteria group bacterium]
MNPEIFRAYDIRGIAGKDLTEESIYKIGRAAGTYMIRKYGRNLVVGRDNRTHGEKLQKSFIIGLIESGCNVTNINLATSPMIYWTVCKYEFDGGMNITASHNPKEYNGIKVVAKNAHSVCGDELREILRIALSEDFEEGVGNLEEREIASGYNLELLSKIFLQRPLKIVVDAGNGTTGAFAPELFRAAGCEVHELYCDLDGTFPNHEANPESAENLADLSAKVAEIGADLGIGFDGDGDRVGIVDEKGKHYSADYLLILLARDLLTRHPGETIIFDTKTSKIVENDIRNRGGEPLRYKTGHSFIETKMKEIGSLLAGECSGHMFIGENYYGFDDAFLATLKILEIISRSDKAFSEHFQDLETLITTPEIKLACPDNKKFEVVKKLVADFQRDHKTLTIDGAFVEFDDKNWGAVRCSNTTPCLTLRFEAETEEKLAEMKHTFAQKLVKHPEIDMSSF